MPETRSRYPPEYRRRISELMRAGRSPASLTEEFEASEPTIRNWVRQANLDEGTRTDGLTTTEREELSAAASGEPVPAGRAGDRKKAAAWFAQESRSIPPKSSPS